MQRNKPIIFDWNKILLFNKQSDFCCNETQIPQHAKLRIFKTLLLFVIDFIVTLTNTTALNHLFSFQSYYFIFTFMLQAMYEFIVQPTHGYWIWNLERDQSLLAILKTLPRNVFKKNIACCWCKYSICTQNRLSLLCIENFIIVLINGMVFVIIDAD